MKVLVLGGSGFLGSYLVPKLQQRGFDVTVLSRNKAALSSLEDRGVKGILGDLLEPEAFIPSLDPHDVVVSIAMPLEFGKMSKKKFEMVPERTTKFNQRLTLVTNWIVPLSSLWAPATKQVPVKSLTKPGQ